MLRSQNGELRRVVRRAHPTARLPMTSPSDGWILAADQWGHGEILVQRMQPSSCRVPGVGRRTLTCGQAHGGSEVGVVEDLGHRLAIVARIATRDQTPGRPVVDEAEQAADGARHDRRPAGRRLERNEPEALRPAGHDDDVGGSVVARQHVVGLRRDEHDAVVQVEFVDEVVRSLRLESAALAARPAHDDQHRVGVAAPAQVTQRPNRDVGPLQRLDATHEDDQRNIEVGADGPAGTGSVARSEESVFDPGGDDLDPTVRVAVQPSELLLLLHTADADRVRALDDLGFGPVTPFGLGVTALGLHPSEGVERRHERHAEFVLEVVSDDAAQPVVAVDDVGRAIRSEPLHHPVAELVRDIGQRLFRQVMRTGLDVDDPVIRLDLHLGRETLPIGASEGDALDAGLRQRRDELAYVDVHSPAVARAGLQERRGVEGDDRNAPDATFARFGHDAGQSVNNESTFASPSR